MEILSLILQYSFIVRWLMIIVSSLFTSPCANLYKIYRAVYYIKYVRHKFSDTFLGFVSKIKELRRIFYNSLWSITQYLSWIFVVLRFNVQIKKYIEYIYLKSFIETRYFISHVLQDSEYWYWFLKPTHISLGHWNNFKRN